ncbi:MAG: transcriptional repressor [Lachnospiraceae bacterium]|nr:transcriptional repressor [Lachnospiraceae bacterium]
MWPEGIKKTKQREDVFRVLVEAKEPLSAIEIYNRIQQQNGQINYAISTIYRSLAVFEEKGLVEKSTLMGEDTAVYEWQHGKHKHYAICLKCHKLVPLAKCPFEHVKLDTSDEDFTVTSHKLEIYGYCNKCKEE